MAAHLDPSLPLAAELLRVTRAELDAGIAASVDRRLSLKQRVHAGRKCCKKVRALFRLSRSSDRRSLRRENLRLREAARSLSDARDAHVLHDTLACLRHGQGRLLTATERSHLDDALARRQSAAAPIPFESFARHLRAARTHLRDWTPHEDSERLMIDFRKGYARCRRALAKANHKKNARTFHEWRKAVKTHFYQARFLRRAWAPGLKPLIKELKLLGEDLGREHDLSVLRHALKRLVRDRGLHVDRDSVSIALRASARQRAKLRATALIRGERLFAEKPRAFAERIVLDWDRASEKLSAPRAAAR